MTGTLALVGSGEYLPPMDPVDKYLLSRLNGPARVVCLPTAAGTEGEERLGYWTRLGVEHFTRLGAEAATVRVIDRASAQAASNAEKIRAANFVYLSGGDPGYLHKTLTGTPTWEAILHVFENGGVVAGCSAGAMIFGEKIPSFPTIVPLRSVFNLLPGAVIVPHYDEFGAQWGPLIKAMLGHLTLLGVEGNTALVKLNGTHTAVGAGGVTVWSKKQKTRFTDGQTVNWP